MSDTLTFSLDSIRSAIFDSEASKPKSKVVDAFGTKVEIRQPAVGDLLQAPEDEGEIKRNRFLVTLINNTYVPGTDTKIFSIADYDSLVKLPFGSSMTDLIEAVNALSGVDVKGQAKN